MVCNLLEMCFDTIDVRLKIMDACKQGDIFRSVSNKLI
jgi:hypothetical protein